MRVAELKVKVLKKMLKLSTFLFIRVFVYPLLLLNKKQTQQKQKKSQTIVLN